MAEEKKSSEKVGKIYKQIPLIMADIKAIGKEQQNVQQNFKFRGIDDVYNELQKHLAKHKVFTVPVVLEENHSIWETSKGTKMNHRLLKVRYDFFAEDGSFVSALVMGESLDTGDKGASKALAIAHKYALFQVFCIPTDDAGKDPDAESHQATRQNGGGQKRSAGNGQGAGFATMTVEGKKIEVDYYEVLNWFKNARAQMKKLTGNDSAYYDVLGGHGFEKSNRIPKGKMNEVFQNLKAKYLDVAAELKDKDDSPKDKEQDKKPPGHMEGGPGPDDDVPF